mmetsp:Transcript_53359/g.159247  ORF Transcript_53359/g.159247 Transcript_53359/m.159247 type:complete len:342 (-) Transcript_53359:23-1048(-)
MAPVLGGDGQVVHVHVGLPLLPALQLAKEDKAYEGVRGGQNGTLHCALLPRQVQALQQIKAKLLAGERTYLGGQGIRLRQAADGSIRGYVLRGVAVQRVRGVELLSLSHVLRAADGPAALEALQEERGQPAVDFGPHDRDLLVHPHDQHLLVVLDCDPAEVGAISPQPPVVQPVALEVQLLHPRPRGEPVGQPGGPQVLLRLHDDAPLGLAADDRPDRVVAGRVVVEHGPLGLGQPSWRSDRGAGNLALGLGFGSGARPLPGEGPEPDPDGAVAPDQPPLRAQRDVPLLAARSDGERVLVLRPEVQLAVWSPHLAASDEDPRALLILPVATEALISFRRIT